VQVVFDLTQLLYIDSSGLGELVRCYTYIKRSKGDLLLFHSGKKIIDLLSITKLLSVMVTGDSVESIIPEFQSERLFIDCPHCGLELPLWIRRTYQDCGRCGLRMKVSITYPVADDIEVQMLSRPAYDDEDVSIWPNLWPLRIVVGGRLDLVSFEVLEGLAAIPMRTGPMTLGVELPTARTDAGFDAVLGYCRRFANSIIFVPGLSKQKCIELSKGITIRSQETDQQSIRYAAATGRLMLPIRRAARNP